MIVTMMIGCSYSGKSTFAKEYVKEVATTEIISSDAIRKELYGDAGCQKDHQKVFQLCRKRMHKALAEGKNVILDATFMTRKSRRSFLDELRKYGSEVEVEAVVCAVPLEVLKERMERRERKVPWEVVMRQLKSFEFPLYGEGFDKICIEGTKGYETFMVKEIQRALYIPHDTKWHKESIGDHMLQSYYYAVSDLLSTEVCAAARFHDIGKIYTKEFKDRKGQATKDAHFYGHSGVGAYLYAAAKWQQGEFAIRVAQLISYHMIWAYMDEKGLKKMRELIGEDLWKELEQLHDCDEHGRNSDLEAIY